jgi:hypothetical protein
MPSLAPDPDDPIRRLLAQERAPLPAGMVTSFRAGRQLGVTPRALFHLIDVGVLDAVHLDDRTAIPQHRIDSLIEQARANPDSPPAQITDPAVRELWARLGAPR